MQAKILLQRSRIITLALSMSLAIGGMAQTGSKDKKIVDDAAEAKAEFIKTDADISNHFSSSYGYVIFPNVGKGGICIRGAAGNGAVYQQGVLIGMAKMTQVTIGFQFGGQEYREVIIFENKAALDRFKENKFEFSAQASAVALKTGAAANAKYQDGVMVSSQVKGG